MAAVHTLERRNLTDPPSFTTSKTPRFNLLERSAGLLLRHQCLDLRLGFDYSLKVLVIRTKHPLRLTEHMRVGSR